MAHTCHALGCEVPVAPKLFMCAPHWRTLPRLTQARIWQHYRPGQEQDKRPSPEYVRVAREAIHWLHEHEGKSGLFCVVCIEAEKENPAMVTEEQAKQQGISRAAGRAKKIDPEWEQEARRANILVSCRLQQFTIDEMREISGLRECPSGDERAITAVMKWGNAKGMSVNTGRTSQTTRKRNHKSPRYIHRSRVYLMDPTKFDTEDAPKAGAKIKDY